MERERRGLNGLIDKAETALEGKSRGVNTIHYSVFSRRRLQAGFNETLTSASSVGVNDCLKPARSRRLASTPSVQKSAQDSSE